MTLADFHIEQTLRHTSRAKTALARDTRTGKRVVLKMGRPRTLGEVSLDTLAPALWGAGAVADVIAHEAAVLEALEHPGAPAVIEHGCAQGVTYLATEWINGAPLVPGSLTLAELISIAADLASILAHAHACGVVHRDLKPDNVLIQTEPTPRVVLIDWELATHEGTGVRGAVGTRHYMAPEQLAQQYTPNTPVDGRADLYALGVLMFHAIAGNPPFFEHTVPAAHVLVPAPSLADLGIHVPLAIDALIARLMSKAPDERPPSGDVVVGLLRGLSIEEAEAAFDCGDLVTAARFMERTGDGVRTQREVLLAARIALAVGLPAAAQMELQAPAVDPTAPDVQTLMAESLRRQGALGPALQCAQRAAAGGYLPGLAELARCQRLALHFEGALLTCLKIVGLSRVDGHFALREQVDGMLVHCMDEQPLGRWLALLSVAATQLALLTAPEEPDLFRLALAAGRRALDDDVIGWLFVSAMVVASARLEQPCTPSALFGRALEPPPDSCWGRAQCCPEDGLTLKVALSACELGFRDVAMEMVGDDPMLVERIMLACGDITPAASPRGLTLLQPVRPQ